MPPSPQIIKLMEEKGLIVVANDIASLRRSYAYSPSITDDPTVFYSDFFLIDIHVQLFCTRQMND
jgi:hypothetical protein